MRIFSITSWSHFAYMIISVALLGFGASGTFLSLFQNKLKKYFYSAFTILSFSFSISLFLCFLLSQQIPFDPFLIVWYRRQYLYLLEYYLVLFIPFFLGASCIGLTFAKFSQRISRVYFYNLLGSGGGALGVVLFLYVLAPLQVLLLITSIALLATLISASYLARRILIGLIFSSFTLMILFFLFPVKLMISQYKGLSTTLNLPRAKILNELSSPLGLIDVVSSPAIRHAPGLSLNFEGTIPPQLGIFIDADSMSAITDFGGRLSNLEYLDYTTSSLPYHLLSRPKVLVLGAGGGSEVLTGIYHQASSIEALEVNPQVISLVQTEYADFSNRLYSLSQVRPVVAEGRGFIQSSKKKYDLIQIALLDSFSASSAGVYALSETYLYTLEAIKEYLRHLTPEGILSITRWLKMPPRDGVKIFATAVEALEDVGIEDPSSHLIFIRSWATSTLLVKRSAFSSSEIMAARKFSQMRLFDLIWYPGIKSGEVNRYNRLPEAYYYDASRKILSPERKEFYQNYLFYVRPATDDSPYFFHFFRWKSLPHLLKTMGSQWIPFIEWGYIVLMATLFQAVVVSIVLIILPLFGLKSSTKPPRGRLPILVYFIFLGLGYMFVEISFIQKFTLFLSYPIYAVAVVISGFLFFSGWGSYLSGRIRIGRADSVATAVGAIMIISLIYLGFLDNIFRQFISLSDPLKIMLSLLLLSPLAFFMGIPFPLGLSRVSVKKPLLVAWAWGINGCASVISPVLATVLAISWGFNLVVMLALSLYFLAAIISVHL
ncbi:MAG: spermidine synthase [bacterium]